MFPTDVSRGRSGLSAPRPLTLLILSMPFPAHVHHSIQARVRGQPQPCHYLQQGSSLQRAGGMGRECDTESGTPTACRRRRHMPKNVLGIHPSSLWPEPPSEDGVINIAGGCKYASMNTKALFAFGGGFAPKSIRKICTLHWYELEKSAISKLSRCFSPTQQTKEN